MPVAMLGRARNVLVVHPSVPAKNVAELIAYAKANPGKLNFPRSGMGTSAHLGGELFKSLAGIDIQHIAYKGTGPSLQDLQAGNVQMAVDSLATLQPFIQSGRLVALGISNTQRNPLLPDAPPIADSLPGYQASTIQLLHRAQRHAEGDRRPAEPRHRRGAGGSRRCASACSAWR